MKTIGDLRASLTPPCNIVGGTFLSLPYEYYVGMKGAKTEETDESLLSDILLLLNHGAMIPGWYKVLVERHDYRGGSRLLLNAAHLVMKWRRILLKNRPTAGVAFFLNHTFISAGVYHEYLWFQDEVDAIEFKMRQTGMIS